MWFIYTMEYYSVIKIKGIKNFADKWIELENIVLNDVTQNQNDIYGLYMLIIHQV